MAISIKVVNSGSSGNCYAIESNGQILLVELGCPFMDILESIDFKKGLQKLVGILISHKHSDHLNLSAYGYFSKAGYPMYSNAEVHTMYNDIKLVEICNVTKIGDFYIQPFNLEHSAMCYGYLIDCPSGERILFATDCVNIPYDFSKMSKKINVFMVEANYDTDTLIDFATSGEDVRSGFQNHMNIEDTSHFLLENFSGECNQIILIHLSSTNSDANKFIQLIKNELSFNNVDYAIKGKEYIISNEF